MYSIKSSFLNRLELPAEISAGLIVLNKLRKKDNVLQRENTPPLAKLPECKQVHSSEAARKGYLEALHHIHQECPPFTIDTVLLLHQKVFQYLDETGGHFKLADNHLEAHNIEDGKKTLIHTPFAATEIPEAMETLISRYHHVIQTHDPLVVIPLTLMDFIFIHPFMDGNGRMFRLLSVALLYQAGFDCASQIQLDYILQNSRHSGQTALQAGMSGWREGKHNVLPWINYFLGAFSYAQLARS